MLSRTPLKQYEIVTFNDLPQLQNAFEDHFNLREFKVRVPSEKIRSYRQHIPLNELSLNFLDWNMDLMYEAMMQDSYNIQLPVNGTYTVHEGDKTYISNPELALVLSPTRLIRWELFRGCKRWCVNISRHAVEKRVSALLGRAITEPIVFQIEMSIQSGVGASWWEVVKQLFDQLSFDYSILEHKLVCENFESMLINGLLLGQPHNYSEELQGEAKANKEIPVYLQRAEVFIREKAQESIDINDIVNSSGVSYSRLYNSFKQQYGMSPIHYLTSVRMEGARKDILSRESDQAISAIAMEWGFFHLGRFSVNYKKIYGESPSETWSRKDEDAK